MAEERSSLISTGTGYAPAPDQFRTSSPQYGTLRSSPQPVMIQQPSTAGAPPVATIPAPAATVQPLSHLRLSIIATLVCGSMFPLIGIVGIFAIYMGLKVNERYSEGDHQGAIDASKIAFLLARITIVVPIVLYGISAFIVALVFIIRVFFSFFDIILFNL